MARNKVRTSKTEVYVSRTAERSTDMHRITAGGCGRSARCGTSHEPNSGVRGQSYMRFSAVKGVTSSVCSSDQAFDCNYKPVAVPVDAEQADT